MVKLALFQLVATLASHLPRPWLAALGYLAGAIAFAAASHVRQAVLRNLRVALPEASEAARRRLALRMFVHGAWSYLELLGMPAKVSLAEIAAAYPVQGWEHFDRAVATGKGVVVVTAHLGQPQVAGQLMAARGVPTTVLVEQLEPPQLHELVTGRRAHFGLRIVPLGRSALREALGALRRGEVVGIVCDRDVAGSGEWLPFFGRPTRVTTAPAALARRTGAMLLPSVAYRTRLFEGSGYIDEPFEVARTADPSRDVREATERLMSTIERFIRAHPEQWVVFSDVWTVPENVSEGQGAILTSVTIPTTEAAHSSVEAAGDT